MRIKVFMMAAIAVLLGACSQDKMFDHELSLKKLSAGVEGNEANSKVGFADGTGEFFWTKGDKIGVTTSAAPSTFQGMTLDGDGGNGTGEFLGNFNGTISGYAVYPYGSMDRHALNGTTLSYKLPESYTYTSLDAEYAKADGNSHNAPMWGAIDGSSVSFKHLGGVFAIEVNNLPENTTGLKFVLRATKKINGVFDSDLSATEPVIATSETTEETEKTVTIHFGTAAGQTKGHFYVPLPTGNLGTLMLSVLDGNDNEVATGGWENFSIARADIKRTKIGNQSITGGMGLKEVASIAAITEEDFSTTEENLTIQVSGEVSGTSNVITLPASLATKTTTFSFETIAAGAKIEIEEETANSYEGQIIIEIPEGATLPEVVASVPNGEVYIKQGTVTTLVVASAQNTTIIGANAKVGTLTVLKGNVRVKNGGEVTTIVRDNSNTDARTYVIFEGTMPATANPDSKIVYISAAEYDLKMAIAAGGEVTLTENITLTSPIFVSKTVSLNLNGKTIHTTGNTFYQQGVVSAAICVVENGVLTIDGEGIVDAIATDDYAVEVRGGELDIKNGKYVGSVTSAYALTGTIRISGGEFAIDEANTYNYAYVLNLLDANGKNGTAAIQVTGGKFYKFNPAYNPSENPAKNYLVSGYYAKAEGDYYVLTNEWDGITLNAPRYDASAKTYYINNASELAWIAAKVNGTLPAGGTAETLEGCTVALERNIDLNNQQWMPIGFNPNDEAGNEPYFSGIFDGKGNTIRNLKIDVKDKGGVGLFGAVHNATFKNFTLNNVDIKAVESENDPANSSGAEGKAAYIVGGHTGAIAGYDAKSGTLNFEAVHVTGLIKIEGETRAAQGQRIGGIFGGRLSSTVNFSNVSVKGSDGSYIKGYCSTAGVIGQNQATGTFTNVQTDIDIYAVTFGAGGIVGIARQGSTFTNCSSAGDITLDASKTQLSSYSANYPYRVGGIAGCWSESSTGVLTLTGCSYNGTLTSIDKEGNKVNSYDYAGYVGRGYTLNGCQGSKVVVNGVSYVQACNTAALAGIYIVDGVYEIGTATALKWFANEVNTGNNYFTGKTVKLTNDIDLNNEEWTPIGYDPYKHTFCGNFDGNNKTIKNLKISEITLNSDSEAYAGLFGVTEGTDNEPNYIKNLTIENVNISSEGHIVAAAIAYPYYTTVENITVKGNVNIQGGNYTAGVLAYTRRCVDAKNLVITANSASAITGKQTVGGVISDIQMNDGLTANYSNFKASGLIITGDQCVGGISGIISSQTLDGATVENVSINCDDTRKGTVSGALGGKSTIKNISVTNVTGADSVVGATYDGANEVTVNGDVYDKKTEVNN